MITDQVAPKDGRMLPRLHLLVAPAADKGRPAWSDDESLTPHGAVLLERLVPAAPGLAALSLAPAAATARDEAACPADPRAVHLHRLDAANRDKLALQSVPLVSVPPGDSPITPLDDLHLRLVVLAGARAQYSVVRKTDTRALLIGISAPPPGVSPLLHRAQALAWALRVSSSGKSVFPFTLERQSGFEASQLQVQDYLSDEAWRPLPDLLEERLAALNPAREAPPCAGCPSLVDGSPPVRVHRRGSKGSRIG